MIAGIDTFQGGDVQDMVLPSIEESIETPEAN